MDAMLVDDNAENDRSLFVDSVEKLSRHNHADTDTYIFTEQELLNYSSSIAAEWLRVSKSEQHLADCLQRVVNKQRREIESLQAKLAMQAEIIKNVNDFFIGAMISLPKALSRNLEMCDSYTQADVDAFMQGKKAEIEKGVLAEAAEDAKEWAMQYVTEDNAPMNVKEFVLSHGGVR